MKKKTRLNYKEVVEVVLFFLLGFVLLILGFWSLIGRGLSYWIPFSIFIVYLFIGYTYFKNKEKDKCRSMKKETVKAYTIIISIIVGSIGAFVGAILGAILGMFLGEGIAIVVSGSAFGEDGFIGFLFGIPLGLALGSFLAVVLVNKLMKQHGSSLGALMGAFLSIAFGVYMLFRNISGMGSFIFYGILMLVSGICVTIGYYWKNWKKTKRTIALAVFILALGGAFFYGLYIIPPSYSQIKLNPHVEGCESVYSDVKNEDYEQCSSEAESTCISRGGDWRTIEPNLLGCVYPYSDGGVYCTSSDQCEGDCVVDLPSQLGVEGFCEYGNGTYACHNTIENEHFICFPGEDYEVHCDSHQWDSICDTNFGEQ